MNTQQFHSLHEFSLYTDSITYILMGLALIGLAGFWWFLSSRDDDIKKY